MSFFKDVIKVWYDECRFIFHDKGIMIFVLFVPLCYPLLYSWVYTNEVVREVPAVVIDHDGSALSRKFKQHIDGTPDVKIIGYCPSMHEAERMLEDHQIYGIYEIPENFSRRIAEDEQVKVGLYADLSSMLYYKALLLGATNVYIEMNKDIKVALHTNPTTRRDEEISKMPIEYDHKPMFNPQSGFAAFLIPPVLMLIIQQTLLLGIGMQMGSTRELYHGHSIPTKREYHNPVAVTLGKTVCYFGIYFIEAIYMFTAVNRWFGLPVMGHYGVLLAFIIPFILSCIFFAITLSSLIYRREDCILIFVFMSVPCLFLSGVSWPGSAMPPFWKTVSCFFPSTFGMNGYIKAMSMGDSLPQMRTEMIGLLVQCVVYFTTACLMYRHETHKKLKEEEASL